MVSYSTNWMGPISLCWFRERGMTRTVSVQITSQRAAATRGVKVGERVWREEATEHWCGGRIDIYGLNDRDYYGGRHEYPLPIMDGQSWRILSDWLEDFESEELLTFDELLGRFETASGHQIVWAPALKER